MAVNIASFRRPGVFLEEINKSALVLPAQQQTYQLVVGFSRKGPYNAIVPLRSKGERESIFGKIDRNLERKGSFFHRTIDTALESGPVLALNLLLTNEQDQVAWRSISTSSTHLNGVSSSTKLSDFYNKNDFWEKDKDMFLFLANNGVAVEDRNKVLHLANFGDRKTTVYVFKSAKKGFDVPAVEWYGDTDSVPTFMHPTDLISDYMVRVLILSGDWTDYERLSSDPVWSKYFDTTGLIKVKFDEFVSNPLLSQSVLGYYDASLIPDFRDKSGTPYSIEATINSQSNRIGLYCAYDTEMIEDTDYPRGLIDLLGDGLPEGQEEIEFLSYKETIVERMLFESTYAAESDGDGKFLSVSGLSSFVDENATNVSYFPIVKEFNPSFTLPAAYDIPKYEQAATPQRSYETDLSEMTAVGLKMDLYYSDTFPTSSGTPSSTFDSVTLPWTTFSSQVKNGVSATPHVLWKLELTPAQNALSPGQEIECYYVINGRKVFWNQVYNPNSTTTNTTTGLPAADITLGPDPGVTGRYVDVVVPPTGYVRVDLILLDDSGQISIKRGVETAAAAYTVSGPGLVGGPAGSIPTIPSGMLLAGYLVVGQAPYGYGANGSVYNYYPVSISGRGPIAESFVRFNTKADTNSIYNPTPFPYDTNMKFFDVLFYYTELGKPAQFNASSFFLYDPFAELGSNAYYFYHAEQTRRRYYYLKSRILGNSDTVHMISETAVENPSFPGQFFYAEKRAKKVKVSAQFEDPSSSQYGRIRFVTSEPVSLRRASTGTPLFPVTNDVSSALTLYFKDSEQLVGLSGMKTSLLDYAIRPSADSEYDYAPFGVSSDVYTSYIDGFVNTEDYFYQAIMASDANFGFEFSPQYFDSVANTTIRKNVIRLRSKTGLLNTAVSPKGPNLDPSTATFSSYKGYLASTYADTVLKLTQLTDVKPGVETKIKISGSKFNDGIYTVKTLLQVTEPDGGSSTSAEYADNAISGQADYIEVYEDLVAEAFDDSVRVRVYNADEGGKVYVQFKKVNSDVEVAYFSTPAFDSGDAILRITPLTAYIGLETFSLKDNLKQTVDIEALGEFPNQIIIAADRYTEIKRGDYLEAYYDAAALEPGEMPKKLARILEKTTYKDSLGVPDLTKVLVTTDIAIKKYGSGANYQTFHYKSIDSYCSTLKGIYMAPFKMRKESMPDGTEERLKEMLAMLAPGTSLYKGLVNKDKTKFRYLVDSFGLGLHEKSKQEYLDLLNAYQAAFGIVNMPSAKDFRMSVNPSFINVDGSLNMEYVKLGADPLKTPLFRYTFGEDYGQTYVGYFFPYVLINDGGRSVSLPPSIPVSKAYMRKFVSNSTVLGPGSVVAGIEQGLINGIIDVEHDCSGPDIEQLNEMGANAIVYKMDQGFCIEMQNTAAVAPLTALSYISTREVLLELEAELRAMLIRYQWKYNTADVRAEIKFRADQICQSYVNKGWLNDFENIMDETNNGADIIDAQMGVLDTFVEVSKAFAILLNRLTILRTGDIRAGNFSVQ